MGDALNNTIRVFFLCFLVISFSSCERKKIEEQKDPKKEQVESSSTQNRFGEENSHSFLKNLDSEDINEYKASSGLSNNTLNDTGVETPEPELPEYASAVMREFISELEKDPSKEASRLILNDLAKKYWVKSFEKEISLNGLNFSALFNSSENLIEELRTGGRTLDLDDEELKSSYALYVVMALFSQGTTTEIDLFFKQRMNASSTQIGDLLLARIASQVRPFKGNDSVENIRMLGDMGNASNPVYRALAVASGNTYIKDEKKLFEFYRGFEEDPQPEVTTTVLDELAKLDSEASFLEIERIMKKSKGENDSIHIHAKKLLENRER